MDTFNKLIKMIRPMRGIDFSLREEEIKLYSECTNRTIDEVKNHALKRYETAHNEFDSLKKKLIDSFYKEEDSQPIKPSRGSKRKLKGVAQAPYIRPTTGALRMTSPKQRLKVMWKISFPLTQLRKTHMLRSTRSQCKIRRLVELLLLKPKKMI